jgi:hypothetical protein
MFGHHKAKRENKRLKRQNEKLQSDANKPPEKTYDQQLAEKTEQNKQNTAADKAQAQQSWQEFEKNKPAGFAPEEKKAMQYAANQQIKRSHNAANRKLLGSHAQHGIVGKGGVGYAQQRDLSQMAQEAEGAATRDINQLDEDLAMKKMAAMFAFQQGEISQAQLNRQMAQDELNYKIQRDEDKKFKEDVYRQFSRI